MQVPVFTSAAEILARLKTVDSDVSGLNANTLQGYQASAFSLSGHTHSYQPLDAELTAIAGLTSAANTVPSFTGSGTAALLTVGTGANNLVQLTAASKLPAVDGSLLTNLPAPSGVLLATGATTGATSQAQTFTNGVTIGSGGRVVVPAITTNSSGAFGSFELQSFAVNNAWLGENTYFNGGNFIYRANGTAILMYFVAGGLDVRTIGSGTAGNSYTPLRRFRVGNGGDVGIGGNSSNAGTHAGATLICDTSGRVGIGVADSSDIATVLDVLSANASTSAIANTITLRSTNAGTPAAGFGVGLRAGLKSSTTVNQDAGRLTWEWITATHASRASKGQLTALYTSTERAAMTWGADASGPLLGFGAVTTPIAIPVLPTGAAHTTEDIIAHLQSLGLARQS